jgi:cold shock CspA family protein
VIEAVVASFDEHAGWGTLASPSGETLFFHCVEIRGGSRRIDVGTRVMATRVAGQRGRDEAADVHPMSSEIS